MIGQGPRHTLALHLTERAMFGQYSCHAHNQLGSAQSSVTITGLASPPVFSSDKVSSSDGNDLLVKMYNHEEGPY